MNARASAAGEGFWARRRAWGRTGALCFAALCLAAAVLVYRIDTEGSRELRRSDRAFNRGDLDVALEHAQQSALWYLPSAPHVEGALQRIHAIAMGAEASGEPELALRAWGALRNVLHETWHVHVVDEELWDAANRGLLRLLPQTQPEPRFDAGALGDGSPRIGDAAPSEDHQLAQLRADYGRAPTAAHWSLATTFGMLLMLGGSSWMVVRQRSQASAWWGRAALAVGVSLWIMAALGA